MLRVLVSSGRKCYGNELRDIARQRAALLPYERKQPASHEDREPIRAGLQIVGSHGVECDVYVRFVAERRALGFVHGAYLIRAHGANGLVTLKRCLWVTRRVRRGCDVRLAFLAKRIGNK